MPIISLYKKFAIMWVVKNMENWYNTDKFKQTRENKAYDVKINYMNTSFGQTFVDYLGPKFYNSLDLDLKKKIIEKPKHAKNIIKNWSILNIE